MTSHSRENPSLPAVVLRALALLPRRLKAGWWGLVPLLVVESAAAAAVYLVLAGPGGAAPFSLAGLPGPLLLAALLLLKNVLVVATTRAEAALLAESMRSAFERLLRGFVAAPLASRNLQHAADLTYTAGPAVDEAFRKTLVPAANLATEAAVVSAITAVLVVRAPLAGLLAAGLLGIALVATIRATERAVTAASRDHETLSIRLRRDLGDVLGGIADLQALGREEPVVRTILRRHETFARAHRRLAAAAALSRPLVELVFVAGLFAAVLAAPAGAAPSAIPLLGLFAYAGFRILPAANRTLYYVQEMRAGRPAVLRLEIDLARFPAPPGGTRPDPAPFRDRIDLDGVTVRPEGSPAPALAGVSLVVRQGEMIGVAGSTGAGKSTLLTVLAGLRAPDAGTVRFDGMPAADPGSGRRRTGYVPQAPFVADDTLLRNVAFGLPDAEIDEDRARAALEDARLLAFATRLPDGLASRAGENGALLSGGERQRLAVARALYADPEILLLDEATSALDPATEGEVVAALRALVPRKTVVLVSHRPEALRAVDRIVFLERGRVVADGPFETLVSACEEFRALVGRSGPPAA